MKNQEYYDYSKDDGRDSYNEPKEELQQVTVGEPHPENPKRKKKGCLGCYIIIISFLMTVVAVIVMITARSSAPEKTMPIDVKGKKIVIVEDVNPDTKYGISMQVTLAGNNYYTYTETVETRRNGRTRRKNVTRKSLVHRVPYTVKGIRESNGEVVLDLYNEFENGNDEVVKTQNEYLNNSPRFSRDLTKFNFTDKVRFEFTVNTDEKYKTVVEEGEVSVYQMSNVRNATWQIALLIILLGFLGLGIGFVVALIQFFYLAAKEKDKQRRLSNRTKEVIEIEVE